MMDVDVPKHPSIEEPEKAAYWAGVENGLRRFAWWKDGTLYVGTCETTLREAIRDMDKEAGIVCLHPSLVATSNVSYCDRCGMKREPDWLVVMLEGLLASNKIKMEG